MKDLAAEFRSEVTIYLGRVTDITLVDVGLEPLREFNTSFRQRFPPPTTQCCVQQQPLQQQPLQQQPQHQVCGVLLSKYEPQRLPKQIEHDSQESDVTTIPSLDLAQLAIRMRVTPSSKKVRA
jgi:hypothetical protein